MVTQDLLVRLYDLPSPEACLEHQRERGTLIRPAMAYEKVQVTAWVREAYNDRWASECDVAFARIPISCFIATKGGAIAGFACYDVTARGFFGPIGVAAAERGHGVGEALLMACLHALRALGHAYAIVGCAGEAEVAFYRKSVGAVPIEGSSPGVYRDRLSS